MRVRVAERALKIQAAGQVELAQVAEVDPSESPPKGCKGFLRLRRVPSRACLVGGHYLIFFRNWVFTPLKLMKLLKSFSQLCPNSLLTQKA